MVREKGVEPSRDKVPADFESVFLHFYALSCTVTALYSTARDSTEVHTSARDALASVQKVYNSGPCDPAHGVADRAGGMRGLPKLLVPCMSRLLRLTPGPWRRASEGEAPWSSLRSSHDTPLHGSR